MDIGILIAYFAACVTLVLMPGPDIIFVITESLAKGRRTGFVLATGLCSGIIVHTTLCATGIAIAIAATQIIFSAIRAAGAAYLLWLAYSAWGEKISADSIDADFKSGATNLRGSKIFVRGFIMNVSNPKVIIFFLSFLPQFITKGGWPVGVQMAILGLIFMLTGWPILMCVAALAAKFAQLFKSEKFWIAMKYIRIGVFAIIGLSLIAEIFIENF